MQVLVPTLSFPACLRQQASPIRAAIFDVDGVLTDGTLYISEAGETLKAFHALDGHGLKLLAQGGITPIVITGRDSPAVRRRLKDLGIVHAVFGAHDKLAAAEPLLAQLGLSWAEVAVMGDDWPDLPVLTQVAFACAPPLAHAEALQVADYVTQARAGEGAARELCDLLLVASGQYARLLADTLGKKGTA